MENCERSADYQQIKALSGKRELVGGSHQKCPDNVDKVDARVRRDDLELLEDPPAPAPPASCSNNGPANLRRFSIAPDNIWMLRCTRHLRTLHVSRAKCCGEGSKTDVSDVFPNRSVL